MAPEGVGSPFSARRQEATVLPFDKTKQGRPIADAIRRHVNQEFKSQFKRREQFNTDEVDAFLEGMPQRLRNDAIVKVAKFEEAWNAEQRMAQAKARFEAAEKALDLTRSISQEKRNIDEARTINDPQARSKALKLHREAVARYRGEREIALGALEPIRTKVLTVARAYRAAIRHLPKVADSAREVAEAEIVRKSKQPITNRRDLPKPIHRPPSIQEVLQPRLRPGFEVPREEPGGYEPILPEAEVREPSVGLPPIPDYRLDPRRGAEILHEVPKAPPLPQAAIERLLNFRADQQEPRLEIETPSVERELSKDEYFLLTESLFATLVQAINSDDPPEEVQDYLSKALTDYDNAGGSVEGFVTAMLFAGLQESKFAPNSSFFTDVPYLQAEKMLIDMVNEGLTTLDAVGVAKAFPGYLQGLERAERNAMVRSMLHICRERIADVAEVL